MTLLFPKPTKTGPKPRKRMKAVSDKRAAYLASRERQADLAHMAKVAQLSCAICFHHGLRPVGRVVVHHVISGRYSQAKAPDTHTIPLCSAHHNHDDPSVAEYPSTHIPIHHNKAEWERLYGPDTDYLPWVLDQIKRNQ